MLRAWQKRLLDFKPNELFDFSSSGTTQQLLPAGQYDVWLVGGGGGGALLNNPNTAGKHWADGGVGGVIHVQISIPVEALLTITVGAYGLSGMKQFSGAGVTMSGNNGTPTTITWGDNSIIAGAGTGGVVTSTGGTLTTNTAGTQGKNSATGSGILRVVANNEISITSPTGNSTMNQRTPVTVANKNWPEDTERGRGGDVGWVTNTSFQSRSGGSGFVRIKSI